MRYSIKNVHCQNCVNKIKNALSQHYGEIAFSDDLRFIDFKELQDESEFEELSEILEELGFSLARI